MTKRERVQGAVAVFVFVGVPMFVFKAWLVVKLATWFGWLP